MFKYRCSMRSDSPLILQRLPELLKQSTSHEILTSKHKLNRNESLNNPRYGSGRQECPNSAGWPAWVVRWQRKKYGISLIHGKWGATKGFVGEEKPIKNCASGSQGSAQGTVVCSPQVLG